MKIGFITSNNGKLSEFSKRLTHFGHDVEQLSIEYPEPQVDAIEGVARFGLAWIKERIVEDRDHEAGAGQSFDRIRSNSFDMLVLEDSGLFVHSLNGFPGVYSKFVFKSIGYSGVLKLLVETTDRRAHFESCIGALKLGDEQNNIGNGIKGRNDEFQNEGDILLFKGKCHGSIVDEPRGDLGFGYDPIFCPNGADRTFAEMAPEEKNKWSHRGKAMDEFLQYILSSKESRA